MPLRSEGKDGEDTSVGGAIDAGLSGGRGRQDFERRATDLQRFAPRDDPAAHGRARALGRVQTRDRGGAHDGGRHGS